MAFYGHISLDLMPYLSVAETQLLVQWGWGVKMISADAFRESGYPYLSTESRKSSFSSSSFCRGRDKLQQNRVEKGFPSTTLLLKRAFHPSLGGLWMYPFMIWESLLTLNHWYTRHQISFCTPIQKYRKLQWRVNEPWRVRIFGQFWRICIIGMSPSCFSFSVST